MFVGWLPDESGHSTELKDYTSHSDQERWKLIKINDRQAFETIYRRHWAGLMMSAYHMLEDKEKESLNS